MGLLNKVYDPINPSLIDSYVKSRNERLVSKLDWLDNAFGLSEQKTFQTNGQQVIEPTIYMGEGKDYLNLFPDESFGNYIWWEAENIHTLKESLLGYKCRLNVIAWFDYHKVYEDGDSKRIFNVIEDFIKAMDISVDDIITEPKEVYRGYTTNDIKNHSGYKTNEVENQYNMRPYGLFKLRCEVEIRKECSK